MASLELGLESAAILGACDGASCALTNTIAWSTPTTPLPMENDPRSVFERLFGRAAAPIRRRGARGSPDRSMLDVVTEQVARLSATLGAGDQAKIEEYLESIRDVERRIQKAEEQNARSCRSSTSRRASRATTPSTPS